MRKNVSLTSKLMKSKFARLIKYRIMRCLYYLVFGWTCGDTPRYLHQKAIVLNFIEKINSSEIILDVGCGTGMYTLEIVEKASTVLALDLKMDFIKFVKRIEPKLHVVLADAQYLPFKNEAFDKLLCIEVLEHLNDDIKGIREIARCSKKGGLDVFSVPNDMPCKWFKAKVCNRQNFRKPFGHKREGYRLSKLITMLEETGLIIENYETNMYFFTQLALYMASLIDNRLPAILVTMIASFDKVMKYGEPYDIVIKARKANNTLNDNDWP